MSDRMTCGFCGEMISESAVICPYCKSQNPHRGAYALAIVGVVILGLIFAVNKLGELAEPSGPTPMENASDVFAESPDYNDAESTDLGENAIGEVGRADNLLPASTGPETSEEVKSVVQSVVPTPASSPALAEAIDEAVRSGSTVRWNDDNDSGYVVVSEPQAGGKCRNMYYTADSLGEDWKSNVATICS